MDHANQELSRHQTMSSRGSDSESRDLGTYPLHKSWLVRRSLYALTLGRDDIAFQLLLPIGHL